MDSQIKNEAAEAAEITQMKEELEHLQSEYQITNDKFVELTIHVDSFNKEFNMLCAKISMLKEQAA